MSGLFGVGFLMVVWCLLVVWTGRTAMTRGRSAAVWCLLGGGAGMIGALTGFFLAARLLDAGGDKVNMMATVGALFTPIVALVLPMVLVVTLLKREPIYVARRGAWKVTVMGQGNATISIDGDQVKLELGGTTRTLERSSLTKVEADGECVRITLGTEELVAIPLGTPDTPAGRKHQSLLLAKQLRPNSLH